MIQAIKGISFEVNQGETIALIGANGAGKTTTLHTVTGLLAPKKGNVIFEGQDITKIPAHKIVGLGMAHVPEGRRVFAQLSVYQNLKMGAYTRSNKTEIEETLEMVYRRFPRLEERKNQMAGTLSGGEQQMLAMGRALMSKPKIILLDEPSMGLSPILVNEIFDIIQALNEAGTTVLLVERMRKRHWRSQTELTCWRPDGSYSPVMRMRSCMTNRSRRHILENNKRLHVEPEKGDYYEKCGNYNCTSFWQRWKDDRKNAVGGSRYFLL